MLIGPSGLLTRIQPVLLKLKLLYSLLLVAHLARLNRAPRAAIKMILALTIRTAVILTGPGPLLFSTLSLAKIDKLMAF